MCLFFRATRKEKDPRTRCTAPWSMDRVPGFSGFSRPWLPVVVLPSLGLRGLPRLCLFARTPRARESGGFACLCLLLQRLYDSQSRTWPSRSRRLSAAVPCCRDGVVSAAGTVPAQSAPLPSRFRATGPCPLLAIICCGDSWRSRDACLIVHGMGASHGPSGSFSVTGMVHGPGSTSRVSDECTSLNNCVGRTLHFFFRDCNSHVYATVCFFCIYIYVDDDDD